MTKGGGLPQAAPTQMAGSLRPLLAQADNSDLTPRDCSPEAPRPRAGVPSGGCRLQSLGLGSGDREAERGRETLECAGRQAARFRSPQLRSALRTCTVGACPRAPLPLSCPLCPQRRRFFPNEPGTLEGASKAPSLERPYSAPLHPHPPHSLQPRPALRSSRPVPARPGSLHWAPPGPRPFAQPALPAAASSDPLRPSGAPYIPSSFLSTL